MFGTTQISLHQTFTPRKYLLLTNFIQILFFSMEWDCNKCEKNKIAKNGILKLARISFERSKTTKRPLCIDFRDLAFHDFQTFCHFFMNPAKY